MPSSAAVSARRIASVSHSATISTPGSRQACRCLRERNPQPVKAPLSSACAPATGRDQRTARCARASRCCIRCCTCSTTTAAMITMPWITVCQNELTPIITRHRHIAGVVGGEHAQQLDLASGQRVARQGLHGHSVGPVVEGIGQLRELDLVGTGRERDERQTVPQRRAAQNGADLHHFVGLAVAIDVDADADADADADLPALDSVSTLTMRPLNRVTKFQGALSTRSRWPKLAPAASRSSFMASRSAPKSPALTCSSGSTFDSRMSLTWALGSKARFSNWPPGGGAGWERRWRHALGLVGGWRKWCGTAARGCSATGGRRRRPRHAYFFIWKVSSLAAFLPLISTRVS